MNDLTPDRPAPPDHLTTLAGNGEAEIRVQRSRFLAWAGPASGEDEARALIAATASRHHDARHVCWGWRLGYVEVPLEGRNDDGEPSGTAGEPLLAALRRADLVGCIAVVVRWFGGVKLGTGGLQRAYGEAADLAVAAAPRRRLLLGRRFRLRFPYALQKTLRHQLEARGGRIVAETWDADVAWDVWLPHSACPGYAEAVTEVTHGAVTATPLPDGDPLPAD